MSNDFVRHVSHKSAQYYVRHVSYKDSALHNIWHFCMTRVLQSRSKRVLRSRPTHLTLVLQLCMTRVVQLRKTRVK